MFISYLHGSPLTFGKLSFNSARSWAYVMAQKREERNGGANSISWGWRSPGWASPSLGRCIPEWGRHGNCPTPPSEGVHPALVIINQMWCWWTHLVKPPRIPFTSWDFLPLVTGEGRFPVCPNELSPSLRILENLSKCAICIGGKPSIGKPDTF